MATLLLVDDQVRMYLKIIDAAKPTTTVIVFNRLTSSLDDIVDQIAALPSRAFTSIGLVQDGTDRMVDYRIVEGQEPCALQGFDLLASWSPVITFLQSLQSLTGMATFDFISCLLGANPGFSYAISQISAQLGIALQASTDTTGNLAQGGNWIQESDAVNIQDVYFTEAILGYTELLYYFMYRSSNEMITQSNTGLVSASGNHVLGMKTFPPATIYAWGNSTYGGSGVVTGSGYTAIASNFYAFAALKSDSTIYAWGGSSWGGTGAPTGTGYTAIASNDRAFAALNSSGRIYAWGDSYYGGISGLVTGSGYTAIASNQQAFAALNSSGRIYAWGVSGFGGISGLVTGSGYTSIASNYSAFAALKSDTRIYAWGNSDYGGISGLISGSGYTAIASSTYAFAALKSDTTIYAWGYSLYGGISGLVTGSGYTAIVPNGRAFAALKSDTTIYTWGSSGQGGISGLISGSGYTAIAANEQAFAALKSDSTIYAWGESLYGGISGASGATIGGLVAGSGYTAIASNPGAFAALKSDGTIYAWGASAYGGISGASGAAIGGLVTGSGYTAIASNGLAFAALKSDTTIYAWGASGSGGIGAITGSYTAIASDNYAFAAIKSIPYATIITPPTASIISYGQTLANSILSDGVANVAGLFTFLFPSTIPPSGASTQIVVFTPTDQTTYSSVQVSVTVRAIDKLFRAQFRRAPSAVWSTINPILGQGELAIETDTQNFKLGNATSPWNTLSYGGTTGATGPAMNTITNTSGTRLLISDGTANGATAQSALTFSATILALSTISTATALISTVTTKNVSTMNIDVGYIYTSTISAAKDVAITATSVAIVGGDLVAPYTFYNPATYNTVNYDYTNFGSNYRARTLDVVGATLTKAWNCVALSSSGQYQIATCTTGIYISADYGTSWTFKSASAGKACAISGTGQYMTAVVNAGFIYTSIDYGNTWTQKAVSLAWTGVAVSASGMYQTAVGGNIYTSSDYGNTWTACSALYALAWTAVAVSATGQFQTAVIYVAGVVSTNCIYISSDYGKTWTVELASIAPHFHYVVMSASGKYQAATGGLVSNTNTILISSDYGNTWNSYASAQIWYGLSMSASGQYLTAYVSTGPVYVSSDYGVTWTLKTGTILWRSAAQSATGQYQTAVTTATTPYTSILPTQINAITTSTLGIGMMTSTYTLQLQADGAFKPATTTWTTGSDERIKKNVFAADLDRCYSAIQAIQLKYFNWDPAIYGQNVTQDRHVVGFIAQDVKAIFPKSVEILDEFAIGDTVFPKFHTLNADQIYTANIGAVQRLIRTVDAQQSTLDGFVVEHEAQQATQATRFEIQQSTLQGRFAQAPAP